MISRQDAARLVPMAAAFALTQVVALLVYLAATTLFLQKCGARYMPWTFLAGYVLALVLSAGFRRAAGVRPFSLLAGYFTAYSVFLLAAWANGADGSFGSYVALLSAVIPFPILCWMLFWSSMDGVLVLSEVKSWTPLVMATALFCQVLTGLGTGALVAAAGVETLFAIGAAMLMVSLAVLYPVAARAQTGKASGHDQPDAAQPLRQPLLASLARLVVCFAVFKYLVDYQLNQAVAARFASSAEVAGFLGRFDSLIKATIFCIQTFVVGRLLARFPPGLVMSAMPVALGAASLAVLAGAGFPAILAASLAFTIFDKGINRSCVNLLLAPFPPEVSRAARLRLDGQVFGSGVVGVSVAMIALPALLTPPVTYGLLAVACGFYLLGCRRIDSRYVQVLQQNLVSGSGDARTSALARLRAFGGRARAQALAEMLASPEPERRRQAAREAGHGDSSALGAVLADALGREADERVQAQLLWALGNAAGPAAALEPFLKSPDARVRSNALEALIALPEGSLFERHLDDEHPRARSAAVAGAVLKAREPAPMKRALAAAREMLVSPGPEWRAAACWALGRIGHRALVPELIERLTDPEMAVRRQAALALERTWAPAAAPALERAAADPANAPIEPILKRTLRRLQDRTESEVLSALGSLGREERQALGQNLSALGEEGALLLARVLEIEDPRYRIRLGHAVREAGSPRVRALLAESIVTGEDGKATVVVGKLAGALREHGAPVAIWRVLARLRSRRNGPELFETARALSAAGTRLRLFQAARMLGVAAGDRTVTTALIAIALARDRRAASLSAELLEKQIADRPLREAALALARSWRRQ